MNGQKKLCAALKRIFDDSRYRRYRRSIELRNRQKFREFILVGLGIGALDLVCELLLRRAAKFPLIPGCICLYFLMLLAADRFCVREDTQNATLIFYVAETPLMLIAILMGTFLDPGSPAITIYVFLCVFPLFILDKPRRIAAVITAAAVVFAVCSRLAKPTPLFLADMVNLLTFWLIALGVNIFSLFERLDSVEALRMYRDKSERDVLTGIYNRGGGDEKIAALLREKIPGAFVILDIDNFKQINDTYGHDVGDEMLIRLADTIGGSMRSTDVVMRLGGDEFTIYAVGMNQAENCRNKLAGLLNCIRKIAIPRSGGRMLTVSMGCALNGGAETDYAEMYRRADSALYQAKTSGKNCIVIC